MQVILSQVVHTKDMNPQVTYKKYSTAGVDWAAWLLGIGLGLTLALQATTMRYGDINSVYSAAASLSRIAALVGTYFALVGIFFVARIPAVEKGVGYDRLVAWHRKLGPWSLYLILLHFVLVLVSFAGQDQIPLYKELWNFLSDFPWMWPAMAGFILMMLAGVTSYKKARAKMSYETWWIIHIYTYVAIAASFMHQVLNGQMFVGHPLNRLYWTTLYLLMAAAVIIYRIGFPLVRSIRVGLVVEKVVVEGPGLISVIMRGRNVKLLKAEGGQFFSWRFLTRGHFLMSHPYSLSAAPSDKYMRITIKDLGDHSRASRHIRPGTRVFVEGPYGAFTAGRATQPHLVMVGGGVGITPIRALMEEFKSAVQMDVFYRVSTREELIMVDELDYLVAQSNGRVRVHYLVGSRKDYPMDAQFIKSYAPRAADSDFYVCGPEALVATVRKAAEDLGVPKNRFHDEDFAFHPVNGG
jgi:predicted ferric reductase